MENDNIWTPFDVLIGSWHGTGSGQPGVGTYERTYEFVLGSKFLQVRNKSVYLPQEQNPQGEVHEDWGLFSFDKKRNTLVFRQFHSEGFVNQYLLDHLSADGQQISFITESIENIADGWQARETYKVISQNEFMETFELAAPGKDFELYTESHFWRIVAPTK